MKDWSRGPSDSSKRKTRMLTTMRSVLTTGARLDGMSSLRGNKSAPPLPSPRVRILAGSGRPDCDPRPSPSQRAIGPALQLHLLLGVRPHLWLDRPSGHL